MHPKYNEMTFQEPEETTYNSGEYLLHSGSCTFGFRFASVQTVLEFEEWLSDGVGERDAGGVDEGDFADAPALLVLENLS